jgi:hypothetical protein
VKAKVQGLLDVGFIMEVAYPQLLANVVMACKKNGQDFPKDGFSLTRIDKIVDVAMGCEMMALLDCFSGYHQIWFHREDEEKTCFITPFGTYCYLRMPEGL